MWCSRRMSQVCAGRLSFVAVGDGGRAGGPIATAYVRRSQIVDSTI